MDSTIKHNLSKMLRENPKLRTSKMEVVTWLYYQTFEGIGESMSMMEFFRIYETCKPDSIRRIWADVLRAADEITKPFNPHTAWEDVGRGEKLALNN